MVAANPVVNTFIKNLLRDRLGFSSKLELHVTGRRCYPEACFWMFNVYHYLADPTNEMS